MARVFSHQSVMLLAMVYCIGYTNYMRIELLKKQIFWHEIVSFLPKFGFFHPQIWFLTSRNMGFCWCVNHDFGAWATSLNIRCCFQQKWEFNQQEEWQSWIKCRLHSRTPKRIPFEYGQLITNRCVYIIISILHIIQYYPYTNNLLSYTWITLNN